MCTISSSMLRSSSDSLVSIKPNKYSQYRGSFEMFTQQSTMQTMECIPRNEQRKYVTSYVRRCILCPYRTTSALSTFNPSASYSIVSCSLQSTWYGRIRASLIDGNDAYVNKRRDRVTVAVLYGPLLFVRTSSNPIKSIKPIKIRRALVSS